MRIIAAVAIFLSVWLIPSDVFAQKSDAQQRTEEIIASLNKTKYKVGEKYGVRREKFKSIRSEPVVMRNIADYSGLYEVLSWNYSLELRVASNGKIEASGYEPKDEDAQQRRKFTFKNAKIEGALLTATKVYEDGSTERFEGVFINQTNMEGVSPNEITRQSTNFGLGVAHVPEKTASGVNLVRLFYQKR